jgi:hypothetical protein
MKRLNRQEIHSLFHKIFSNLNFAGHELRIRKRTGGEHREIALRRCRQVLQSCLRGPLQR